MLKCLINKAVSDSQTQLGTGQKYARHILAEI